MPDVRQAHQARSPLSYQDRLAQAMRQSAAYRTAAALAQALGCSNQAVGMVLSGSSKSFAAANHSKACSLLGVAPVWLVTGEGPMRVAPPTAAPEIAQRDPILDDLAVLEPEDADVWRAQIRAAAAKVRREKLVVEPKPKPHYTIEELLAASDYSPPQPKARYTIEELLAASDYSQPQPLAAREWVDAPDVGRELLSANGRNPTTKNSGASAK